MSFPINNSMNVSSTAMQQLSQTSQISMQTLSQILATGKVLEVVINQNKKNGQKGIYLLGQFIPAEVPENLATGQRVKVKVLENGESLVLKVHEEPGSQISSTSPLSQLISSRKMDSLKNAGNFSGDIKLLFDKSDPENLKLTKDVQTLLANMHQHNLLIDESDISTSEQLEKQLENLINDKNNNSTKTAFKNLIANLDKSISALGTAKDNILEAASDSHLQQVKQGLQQLLDLFNANQTLKTLNPLVNQHGHPSIFFVPCYNEGSLSRWEMVIDPESNRKNNDTNHSRMKISIFLRFAALGNIRLQISQGTKDTLLQLSFETEEISNFFKNKIQQLQKILSSAGYQNLFIVCNADLEGSVIPNWYKQITRVQVLA